MRKVTAGLFHSVDGVVQDPFKFQFDSFDDELGKGLAKMINTVDTVVLGRISYQERNGPGFLSNGSAQEGGDRSYSEQTAREIDEEVRKIIDESTSAVRAILLERPRFLHLTSQPCHPLRWRLLRFRNPPPSL